MNSMSRSHVITRWALGLVLLAMIQIPALAEVPPRLFGMKSLLCSATMLECADSCVEDASAYTPLDSCEEGCCDADQSLCADRSLLWEMEPLSFENCVWQGSAGLAIRYRYMHETNRLRPPGPGLSSYHQWRVTPNASITYRDTITGFVEAIDAATFGEELPLLPIDENRADLLQYYVDIKLGEVFEGDLHFRYGRQLLNYGDQHVISPLGWANTFRNFEGFRAYHKSENWDIDAFAVQPVNGSARGVVFKTESFDTPDQSRWLNGVYATYRGFEQGKLDLYWVWSLENEPVANRQDGDRHTLGARYYGVKNVSSCGDHVSRSWSYDFQGAFQFGTDVFNGTVTPGPTDHVAAGFLNLQAGHQWHDVSMKPQLFGLFYLGTGDRDPNDGKNTTYNVLYPLGHAYWGILDNVSGQNLLDYSLGSQVKPFEKLTVTSQFHWLYKHRQQDFIYNVGGVPQGPRSTDPGGTDSRHIGNELDLIATYQVNKNLTLESGYSWFWYGGAVENTTLNRGDARQFYAHANYQF